MLSMNAMSSNQAGYYLGLAREDHDSVGGEPLGVWHGEGAGLLGLAGHVRPDELLNLFAGLSPHGASPLVQFQRHEGRALHRPGWDLTFSVPKTLSVLWSQSSDAVREEIQAACRESACAALDYLQEVAAFTRRGSGKSERGGLIAALFEHSTSRALDPQLHIHCLVMNVGVRSDSSTGTLSSMGLFEHKMAAGALFRSHLSALLTQELGTPCQRVASWFEVPGVDPGLTKELSKRSESIREELARIGASDAKTAARVTLETREKKSVVSRSALFESWAKTGHDFGWGPHQASRLVGAFPGRSADDRSFDRFAKEASARLSGSQAHFGEKDLIRGVAERCQGEGALAPEVVRHARRYLAQSPEIVRLGVHFGEARFTTKSALAQERDMLGHVERLKSGSDRSLRPEAVVGAIAKAGELTLAETRAVWGMTMETRGFAVVSGLSGEGKTKTLNAAVQAWEAEGRTVLGTALSARAAKEFENGTGAGSTTLSRLFKALAAGSLGLSPDLVLVLDEAGMVATSQMERLSKACLDAGAKLVLVEGERRLRIEGPGTPMGALGVEHDSGDGSETPRRKGGAAQAIESSNPRKVSPSRAAEIEGWAARVATGGRSLKEPVTIDGSPAEVEALNKAVQTKRRELGALGTEAIETPRARFFVGDRVHFTDRHRVLGVAKGERGTLVGFDPGDGVVRVELDRRERISFHKGAIKSLALGYAVAGKGERQGPTGSAFGVPSAPVPENGTGVKPRSHAKSTTLPHPASKEPSREVEPIIDDTARSPSDESTSEGARPNEELYIERTR